MGQNKIEKKEVNNPNTETGKNRKGDTGRSSNQGRKEASGGSTNTNNKGQRKGS